VVQVGRDVTWNKDESGRDPWGGQKVTVHGRMQKYDLEIPLVGDYQLENVATAVAALEVLIEQGNPIPADAIQRGFAQVSWPGRMEVLSRNPLFVVDGAHNLHSVTSLMNSLTGQTESSRMILVAGFSRDKSVADMVHKLAQVRPIVFATRSRHPRSLPPSAVAAFFDQEGLEVVESPDTADAVQRSLEQAGYGDLVLATGSLFIAAEAREAMLGIQPEVYPDLLPHDLRLESR